MEFWKRHSSPEPPSTDSSDFRGELQTRYSQSTCTKSTWRFRLKSLWMLHWINDWSIWSHDLIRWFTQSRDASWRKRWLNRRASELSIIIRSRIEGGLRQNWRRQSQSGECSVRCQGEVSECFSGWRGGYCLVRLVITRVGREIVTLKQTSWCGGACWFWCQGEG